MHRLDRKTAGVLLFALDKETTRELQKQFLNHSIQKKYLAIVRGLFSKEMTVDYPLKNEKVQFKRPSLTLNSALNLNWISLSGNILPRAIPLSKLIPKRVACIKFENTVNTFSTLSSVIGLMAATNKIGFSRKMEHDDDHAPCC